MQNVFWYVVTGNVEHAERFDVTGNDVNIILEDGASLDAQRGIAVNYRTDYTNTLNIWGQSNDRGVLNATGGGNGEAGIGGGRYYACGTINIYGGTVNANGANEAAGIGTGHVANVHTQTGIYAAINIYGGNINAQGGWNAAGIGTGANYDCYNDNSIVINIRGGNIHACRGSESASGIGVGFSRVFLHCSTTLDSTIDPDISVYSDGYVVDSRASLTLTGSFMDEYGQVYTGNITDTSDISGKTLRKAGSVPQFTGHSLTLAGDIGVNFFVDMSMLSDEDRQNSTMDFTVNGVTTTDTFDPNFTNENGDYGFTLNISSVQMADTITAVLHYGNGGTYINTYRVEEYFQYVREHKTESPYSEIIDLVEALASYGHYVQSFLADANHWEVGDQHAAMDTHTVNYGSSDIANYRDNVVAPGTYSPVVTGRPDGVSLTYSLNLETTTTIRIFLRCDGGFAPDFITGASIDGVAVDPVVQSDGRIRIDITGITAQNLGKAYTVEVLTVNGTITINLSALSYVSLVIDNSNDFYSDDENALYAMYSLYRYWVEASDYYMN